MKKQQLLIGIALAAMATLSACSGSESAPPPVAVVPPPPPPVAAPPPPPPQTSFSVAPCLSQTVAFGRSLQSLLIPDLVVLDLNQPAGFPNGRDLDDPVIDLTLAALFLRLSVNPVTTLVGVPVNPNVFDQPLRTTFPFYAAPLGTPPLSPSNGSNFNFRPNPVSEFVRVERAGFPAISTAVIFPSARKNAYNDGNPTQDAAGVYVNDILAGYQNLTDNLNGDFRALGLTPCAT